MAVPEHALSVDLAIYEEGSTVLSARLRPQENGTAVDIQSRGDLDADEAAILLCDLWAILLRATIDPDSVSVITEDPLRPPSKNETSDLSEIPF